MDPRLARPSSPGGRRISQHQPFRSSTGTLFFPDDYTPPRTSRETIVQNPRTSAERIVSRVVPRVEAHQVRRAHDDYHVAPRRMTLEPTDPLPRRPLSIVNTTASNRYVPVLTSSVDPPASPASKSRHRDDGPYYIQPASSTSRKNHLRHYSVDSSDSHERFVGSGGPTRSFAINPASSTARLVKTETMPHQRSGQIYSREMEYRGSQPRRRESLSGRRERPMSMGGIESYATSQVSSSSSRESGPPVTTRGLDKLERVISRREGRAFSTTVTPRGSDAYSSTSSKDFARRSRDEPETLNRHSSQREPTLHQDKDDGYTSYREDREPRRHHHHPSTRDDGKERGAGHSTVDLRLEGDRRDAEDRPKKHRDLVRHRERDDDDERERRPRKEKEDIEERGHRSRRDKDEGDDRDHRSRREKDEGNDRDYRSRRDRDESEERERRSHRDRDEKHERHHGSDLALGAASAAAAGLVAEGIRNHRHSRDERNGYEAPVERKSDRRHDRDRERGKDRGESDTTGNSGDNSEERREKERRRERRREHEKEQEREQDGGSRKHADERKDRDGTLRPLEQHHRAASFERGARPDRAQLVDAEVLHKTRRSHKHRERKEDQSSEDEVSSEEQRKTIEAAKPLVRVVSPDHEPKEPEVKPKGILKPPRVRFPEDLNPVREGVAPLGKSKDVPENARWTRISRLLVNPEALEQGNERYEIEGITHVIVLRVLDREEIQQYADLTKKLRLERGGDADIYTQPEEKMHELRALEDEERRNAREPLALDIQAHNTDEPRLAFEGPQSRNPSPYIPTDSSREHYHEYRDRGDRDHERQRERDPVSISNNAAHGSGPNPPYPTDQAYPPNLNPPYPTQDQPTNLPYNPIDPYDPYSAPAGQSQVTMPAYGQYVPAQPPPQPYPLPTHQQPDPYAPSHQVPGSFPPPPVPQGVYAPQPNDAMHTPQGQMPYGQPDEYGRIGQPPAGHF